MSSKNVLGRDPFAGKGVGSLIRVGTKTQMPNGEQRPDAVIGHLINMDFIEVNPYQPRTKFDEEALNELADSIKQCGVIQPITLRKIGDDKYQIISGERRFRASKLAGLTEIPAYVREANDDQMLTMALIENVQREDLDAIEIALSYQRIIDELNITQEELSTKVGKQRSTITNYLRLLKLPSEIQIGIINKDITMGHARALISLDDADMKVKIYTKIIEEDLSVRQVEELIRDLKENNDAENLDKKTKQKNVLSDEYVTLRNQLKDKFKSDIKFKMKPEGKGEIVIPFTSDADLTRIIGIFENINNI